MQLLHQLIGQLNQPAQIWAADGSVLLSNIAFNRLFGFAPNFDWALNGHSLVSDRQLIESGAAVLIQRALQGMNVEIEALHYDLTRQPLTQDLSSTSLRLFLSLYPLLDSHGKPSYVICIVSDTVSSGSRYEHDLMRSQKMENMETLASGVAHEFNNIFTGIKGMTELIKDEVDTTSEVFEFADVIQQNIARGADLIQKLSSFARDLPYSMRRMKISRYLEQALSLIRLQLGRRITVDIEILADCDVLVDPNRMDQALTNVALNAKDAMGGQGSLLLRVALEAPAAVASGGTGIANWVLLEISDSGPGISDEIRGRVLEPFFSTKERGKATGLGLSVTNRIITSHNGLLEIGCSKSLGGAAICIYLPVVPVDR